MPPYVWNREYNAWVKSCHSCKKVVIGKDDELQSLTVFGFQFYFNKASGDGFSPNCRECMTESRRKASKVREMLDRQGGVCAICSRELDPNLRTWVACIDHDHELNMLREVLCGYCNRGMHYVDNEVWLKKAMEYRKRHQDAYHQHWQDEPKAT